MDPMSWAVLNVAFVVAWLLIPLIVLLYRWKSVPARFQEVKDAFLWRGATGKEVVNVADGRIPAWCYLKSLRPLEADRIHEKTRVSTSLILAPIQEQYDQLHRQRRYAIGLGLIMLFSGLNLLICHAWVLHTLFNPERLLDRPDSLPRHQPSLPPVPDPRGPKGFDLVRRPARSWIPWRDSTGIQP